MRRDNKVIQIEVIVDGEGNKTERYIISNPEEIEIITKAQKEAYQNKKKKEQERLTDKRGDFVMSQNEALKELEGNVLTIAERRQFMMLSLFMKPGDKPLMKNGKPLTITDIANAWGLARQKTSEKLTKFQKLGLITKTNTKPIQIFMSEKYFVMGTNEKQKEKFVKLYQKKLNEVIEELKKLQNRRNNNPRVKKKVDYMDVLGTLQVIIPYFHYQSFYLVTNPDEDVCHDGVSIEEAIELKRLKYINKTQIGEALTGKKSSRKIIDDHMDLLEKAGALLRINGKRTRYLVHPFLMYRLTDNGQTEYIRFVLSLFNATEPVEGIDL